MKAYSALSVVLLFSATATLNADVMVFDRGLPTANLNDAAGANRSNVSWAFPASWSGYNWAIGDDFNLGMAGNVSITDLRVWIVGTDSQPLSSMWSDLTLYGGGTTDGSVDVLSTVSTSGSDSHVVISPTTYAGGVNYQGSSGSFIDIWQVDFLLNWNVDGSTTHTFFVGGTPVGTNTDSPFLHASNAGLSGSTQQGADNLYLGIGWTTMPTDASLYQMDSNGNGWDKSSDINVQIFATPEPSAYILLGTVLLSLVLLTRKKKHQEQR